MSDQADSSGIMGFKVIVLIRQVMKLGNTKNEIINQTILLPRTAIKILNAIKLIAKR